MAENISSYPIKIKCPILNGKPCMWGECASYNKTTYTQKYYDRNNKVKDAEPMYIEKKVKTWLGEKTVKDLNPKYGLFPTYLYHFCLKVNTINHWCNHLNSRLYEEEETEELDYEETTESYHVGGISIEWYKPLYDSSPTTKTEKT